MQQKDRSYLTPPQSLPCNTFCTAVNLQILIKIQFREQIKTCATILILKIHQYMAESLPKQIGLNAEKSSYESRTIIELDLHFN